MRGRVAGVAACVALLALLASSACSLFTDLGGFDGDGQTTIVPTLDGASSETSSGGNGNGNDGSTPLDDAGTKLDATDAGDAPIASGPCGATFCDDFNASPFGAKWTGKVEVGGSVSADTNAMLAKVNTAGADALRTAYLYQRFVAPKTASCTFTVHPLDLSAATEVFSFNIHAPGYKSFSLWLSLRTTATEIGVAAEPTDAGTIYDSRGVQVVEMGKDTVITMETDFSKLTLSENGTVVKSESFFPSVVPTQMDIQVGITFQFSKVTSSVRIDDVRCTVTN